MRFPLGLLISFFCGYVALSYELLWFRVYFVSKGALASSFPMLLGVYLLGLAAAAYWSRSFFRTDRARTHLSQVLIFILAAVYVLAYLAIPAYAAYCDTVSRESRVPWLALSAALLGAVFPLISHATVPPDEAAGARFSLLYVANIGGSAAGTLITGFGLMNVWPLSTIAVFLLWVGLAGAIGLIPVSGMRPSRGLATAVALLVLGGGGHAAAGWLYGRLYERIIPRPPSRAPSPIAIVKENRSGVVLIREDKVVLGASGYDGAVNIDPFADTNGIFRAYFVPALHPSPRRVLVIGMSTGAWAQVVAHAPGVEEVTVLEINPGYLDLVARYPEVSGLLRNPKVKVVIDDGRRWLQRNPAARFDLVVANIMLHWVESSSHILSLEFDELVRARLADGGVYYFNTTESGRAIRTAATVFPHTLKYTTFLAASMSPLAVDCDRLVGALTRYQIEGKQVVPPGTPEGAGFIERMTGLCRNPQDPRRRFVGREKELPLITDDNLGYEFDDAF